MNRLTHAEFEKQALADPEVYFEYQKFMAEYDIISELIRARKQASKTQEEIAIIMQTTASVISRIESGGGKKCHSPSLETLKKYAAALGCKLEVKLVPT